jgi:hypothetical protein
MNRFKKIIVKTVRNEEYNPDDDRLTPMPYFMATMALVENEKGELATVFKVDEPIKIPSTMPEHMADIMNIFIGMLNKYNESPPEDMNAFMG